MLPVILFILGVVISINIIDSLKLKNEITIMNDEINELHNVIEDLQNQYDSIVKRETELSNNRLYLSGVAQIDNNVSIQNYELHQFNANADNEYNIHSIVNEPIMLNADKDSQFYEFFKNILKPIDGEFVIDKSELAYLFKRFDNEYDKEFSKYYISINGKLYCTFSGLNYISELKKVSKVVNDIPNNRLIIDLSIVNPYDGSQMTLVA